MLCSNKFARNELRCLRPYIITDEIELGNSIDTAEVGLANDDFAFVAHEPRRSSPSPPIIMANLVSNPHVLKGGAFAFAAFGAVTYACVLPLYSHALLSHSLIPRRKPLSVP